MIVVLVGITIYCFVRGYMIWRRPAGNKYARRVGAVVSILFAFVGMYTASCLYRVLMEILK
jgi:hypothetical protein